MTYSLTDEMFTRTHLRASDYSDELLSEDVMHAYTPGDSVEPKYGSVAAFILDHWEGLDPRGAEYRQAGVTSYGNGYNSLFEGERALYHADDQGFVSARRLTDDEDMDKTWAAIEAEAADEDGPWLREDDEEGPVCEGHADDDRALLLGGIGEPSYCDGTCIPKGEN